MNLDLSQLTPGELAQFQEAMIIMQDQPPLPEFEKAGVISGQWALERFQAGKLEDTGEEKYKDLFNRAVNLGMSSVQAEQFVEHNKVGDRIFAMMPAKVKEQVFAAMRADLIP